MKQPPFIKKLVHLLSKYEKCIDCADDGTHFTIKNPAEFARNVLGKYFKSNQLENFVRQLNIYGFKTLTSVYNIDDISFYHPYYNRNNYQHIKRRKTGNPQNNRRIINTQTQIYFHKILSTQMLQSGVPHATSNLPQSQTSNPLRTKQSSAQLASEEQTSKLQSQRHHVSSPLLVHQQRVNKLQGEQFVRDAGKSNVIGKFSLNSKMIGL